MLAMIEPNTRLIWLETPSNPTMKELDIAAIASRVHATRPDILVAVDNTFLTPVYQRPLTLGADIVVHSATKYLSGHNDLLGGVLVCKDKDLADEYFDSWLLLRSLKTLGVQAVVAYLKQSSAVTKVLYPGKGGMVSF